MVGQELPDVLDDGDELVDAVALEAGEVDELLRARHDGAPLGGAGDGDAATAPELEQALVAQQPERPQDGVGVDVEDGGEVFCRWEPFAWFGLAVGDRAADLGGDLLVEVGGVRFVDLDIQMVLFTIAS